MAGPKRTKTQREHDLVLVAELYLKGSSQESIRYAIQERSGYLLSQQQISYDIQKIHKRWLNSQIVDFDKARSRELAKIDKLEATAWDAWERSVGEHTRELTESTTIGQYPGERHQLITEDRHGGAEYLRTVSWCIEKRCKLLGLDAPDRIEQSSTVLHGGPAFDSFMEAVQRIYAQQPGT